MANESPKTLMSDADSERVVAAIHKAESGTTGEIRIRIDRRAHGPVMASAERAFHRLGMHKTRERNGILIYVALASREFALYGDAAIDAKIGADGWNSIRDTLQAKFRKGHFADGLIEAVTGVGKALAKHFPARPGDRNELSDDLSLGR